MRFLLLIFIACLFCASGEVKRPAYVTADQVMKRIQNKSDTVYVVNFWATWCAPCVKELPNFEKLDSIWGNQKVKVILVSLDFPQHIETKLVPFIQNKNLHGEVVWLNEVRDNEWIPKIDAKWQGNIPATLLMNPANDSRKFIAYEVSFHVLDSLVRTIR